MQALSELREEKGWSVDVLALKAKVKNRTIQKIESENLIGVDFQDILKLRKFFDLMDFEEIHTYYKEIYTPTKKEKENGTKTI